MSGTELSLAARSNRLAALEAKALYMYDTDGCSSGSYFGCFDSSCFGGCGAAAAASVVAVAAQAVVVAPAVAAAALVATAAV